MILLSLLSLSLSTLLPTSSDGSISGVVGALLSVVAVLVLVIDKLMNRRADKEQSSTTKKELNGHYATSKELSEIHDRITDNTGKQTEHCRIQIASCVHERTEIYRQISAHGEKFTAIMRELDDIKKLIKSGNGKN